MQRNTSAWAYLLIALVVAGAGCGGAGGTQVDNSPPVAKITGGPLEGSTASYTARFFWTGWDQDGAIDHFEYALDPPIEFTLDEIMDPEHTGMNIQVLTGINDRSDTLIVSKEVPGQGTVSFRWVETTEFSASFVFETPVADSVFNPGVGQKEPRHTFSGVHVVYVRAQDNEGAYSRYKPLGDEEIPTFRLGFNARTITPVATIESPNIEADLLTVGTTLTVRWGGLDEDSPDPQGKPTGYLYKVLNLTELGINCTTDLNTSLLYLFTNRDDTLGWVYQSAETTSHTFRLPNNRCFMLGVRAVDVAGGVEPILELHRNVFKFRTVPNAGFPVITISEASLGTFVVTYPFQPLTLTGRELQAAVGRPVRLFWTASGEAYGGEIDGCSWGVDIPDLDVEGPGSGWSAWGDVTSTPAITYANPGIHTFYIRCRDTAGAINIAELVVRFVSFPLDREVLYVDDFADRTFPDPATHDTFWLNLFDPVNSEGRFQEGEVSQWDVYGPTDTNQSPFSPDLERMGRYRLLVWSCNGGGYNGASALLDVASKSPLLAAYVRAGGKLWLNGVYTVAATSPPLGSGIANFEYPKMPEAGEFVWDILKVQSDLINNDKGENADLRFVRAIPADSLLTSEPHYYDAMHVDAGKFNVRSQLKSVAYVDAVIDPIFAEAAEDFRGDLDSLYVYGTAARAEGRSAPAYDFRICALRWHDPDPDPEHGRVQWFGFPMYYFKNASAQDTFNKSIDWFREETTAVP